MILNKVDQVAIREQHKSSIKYQFSLKNGLIIHQSTALDLHYRTNQMGFTLMIAQ